MLDDGIFHLLSTAAAVTAILGIPSGRTDNSSGIWRDRLPEATPMPALVFSYIHDEGVMTMDGPDPLRFARIQFSCYSSSAAGSRRLARVIRVALEQFTGTLSDGTEVDNMQAVGQISMPDQVPQIFHTALDVNIAYRDLGE